MENHGHFKITLSPDSPIHTAQLLGHSNVVQNLKNFIESDNIITPLSIAIHGDWGSGKTSIMKTLLANLDESKTDLIFFEAWKFEYLNPAMGLLGTIVQKYEKESTAIKSILMAGGRILSQKYLNMDIVQLIDTVRGNTAETGNFSDRLKNLLAKHLKKKNLVIIIDDLDRCDVENSLQLLAILKLFLDVEKVICIAAVDFKRLQQAWKQKYKVGQEDKDEGQEYLEKIFQIRIGLPKPSSKQLREYLETLMISPPEELLDILSITSPKNPRAIKKILNLTTYRASLLNSDVNYESSILWTILEEIMGIKDLIFLQDYLQKNGNTIVQLIHTNGSKWESIKDIFTRCGLSDTIANNASKLLVFFEKSQILFSKNNECIAQFEKDFDILYNATNEVLQ